MMRSLDIGATGMLAQQMNVDVISNNIANMTTTGYKRQRIEFQDLMYQNMNRPGATSSADGTLVPSGIQFGLGVRTAAIYRMFDQGSLEVTGNAFDLSINGQGFFQVELPDGETAYTRAGNFMTNQDGEIVTAQGYRLLPGFTIPDDAVSVEINEDGEVLAAIDGQPNMQNLGRIEITNFINPTGLEATGDNLYLETESSGNPVNGNPNEDQFGSIRQGILEASNVNSVEEITKLITAQRAYEMNSNIIQTSDEMLDTVNQLR